MAPSSPGIMGPLHEPLFRTLWIASVISYTGTWMQNVGAAWLMTSLTMSPLMVGLVQAAGSIAVFLVVLPAGALADMVDRRKLLLFTQTWMVMAAVASRDADAGRENHAGVAARSDLSDGLWRGAERSGMAGDYARGGLAAQLRCGRGLEFRWLQRGPSHRSGIWRTGHRRGGIGGGLPDQRGLVLRRHLLSVSLEGTAQRKGPLSVPHMFSAMSDGVRHMRGSYSVKSVLVRCAVFSISASALPALLPLLAHPFGSQGYGLLLGFFGVGALTGAALLPLLRQFISADVLVSASTAIFAFTTYAAPEWCTFSLLSLTMFVAGLAWIQILASLNVAAQMMCPAHMRARAISMYLLVLQGGLAGGAALWGEIAELVGTQRSLSYAAIGLLLGIPAATWFRLHSADIQPSTAGMD